MWRLATMGACLITACGLTVSGCTASCRANPEKLQALRRGMSYAETAQVMGCEGKVVAPQGPADDVATFQWIGPGPSIATRTQLDFRDDRLLYYTTDDLHWP